MNSNLIKLYLANKIKEITDAGFVSGDNLTESGYKELVILTEACHKIMLEEGDILDSAQIIGQDTYEVLVDALKVLTGEDDVALLAFLSNERDNDYKYLRATLRDVSSKSH